MGYHLNTDVHSFTLQIHENNMIISLMQLMVYMFWFKLYIAVRLLRNLISNTSSSGTFVH